MNKISMDFDGCLTEPRQQKIAKRLIEMGLEVWCVTHRSITDNNEDLFSVCEICGIPKNRIILAGDKPKSIFLDGFELHWDDSMDEIEAIEKETKCVGAYVCGIVL
jgi:hypothetical protein